MVKAVAIVVVVLALVIGGTALAGCEGTSGQQSPGTEIDIDHPKAKKPKTSKPKAPKYRQPSKPRSGR